MKKDMRKVQKENTKKFWIRLWGLVVIGCLAMGIELSVHAEGNIVGEFEGHPVFDNQYGGVEIKENKAKLAKKGAGYVAVYDPRTTHQVALHMEDQGGTESCWAFSTIAAIESNLIKKGYENETINLSENHLVYFFYNRQTDPVGDSAGDANVAVKEWYLNGGTLQGTALSLTTWSGVVKETVSEDNSKGEYAPVALPAGDCYRSDYRVAATYFYNYNVAEVKQAIQDYGAVASSIRMPVTQEEVIRFWNKETAGYYSNVEESNHAVAIVGWDDTYSKNNFATAPSTDGAWIVKNSYGEEFGEDGYMYVSYEDASLCEVVAFDMEPAATGYAHNYQYDGSANPATYWNFENGTSYANVYQAKANNGYNETLQAVSVGLLCTNVSYSLQIYTGLSANGNPTSGVPALVIPQTGTLTNAGYNRIPLSAPVTLEAGERYAVVLTLSAADEGKVYMACDAPGNFGWIGFQSNTGMGQSYIFADQKWYDFGNIAQVGGSNLCALRIKAYTNNTNEKPSYEISEKSLSLSKGSTATLAVRFCASGPKTVTWQSSNTKVATVDVNGKVKGKKYGTATIKAKFMSGGSERELTCKVTVGPSKVKKFKVKGSKKQIKVTWKKNTKADGYVIYYSKEPNGTYKKLGSVTGKKQSYTKKKLKKGTYYVKMRPYVVQKGKKLYGSYTAVKSVKVK